MKVAKIITMSAPAVTTAAMPSSDALPVVAATNTSTSSTPLLQHPSGTGSFFAKEAAARKLPCVGQARQIEYDPFASPDRALWEEFGDLLGEGLFALIGKKDPSVRFGQQLRAATRSYWSRFIEARSDVLSETRTKISGFLEKDPDNAHLSSALALLVAAWNQLDNRITADLCVNFVTAWREDLAEWQRFSNAVNNVASTREAMDFLQLKCWTLAGFGAALADSKTARSWHRIR